MINLSDHKLTPAQESILAKGPKFAPTPRIDPVDIAAPIETALQFSTATDQVKETTRIKICEAVRKASRPQLNVTKEEQKAWKELKENTTVRILKADKGNATVVMNASDYDQKVHELLDDERSYCLLKGDPTQSTEKRLLSKLRDLNKIKKISDAFYEEVRPSEGSSKPALFYGLVKLHKPSRPLRPVVSTCGTSTYNLAQKLSSILRPLVASSKRILKNTASLVDAMKDVSLMDDEVLVSYDVKSLFTNIPVEEAIIICERRLHADATLPKRTTMSVPIIISLLRFCLTSTSFRYNNQHYQQLDGVAMGSPVSPVVSDIFMEDFEDKALSDGSICPPLWKRFVDDVLAVVKRDKGSPLLDHLNEQHPNIKFTMEEEEEGSLPFMDVRFTRTANGKLHRQVYQKPTHTNRYVQYDSHQPDSVKSGMIAGLVNRAMIVSSDETTLEKEVKHIKTVMASNGYPKQFVDKAIRKQMRKKNNIDTGKNTDKERKSMQTASIPFVDGLSQEVRRLARSADIRCTFFSPNSTQQLYAVKDRLPTDHSTHVVYSIKCNTCEEEYVGETMRALHVRCKEHRDAIRLDHPEKSAVAEHVLDSNNEEPHEIKWSEVTILDHAKHTRERKIREAFQIEKKHPGMNRDRGIAKSSTWNAIVWTATDTCERWSLG